MKKYLMMIAAFLLILGFTATAGATTITINDINGLTPVKFSLGSTTYNVYAGEFLLDVDGVATAGYCVDLFGTTYLGASFDDAVFSNADYIQNGAQAAWLMHQYSGRSAIENAALQLAIWSLEYSTSDAPFTYLGNTGTGTVGYYLNAYLSSLGDNFYSSPEYQIALLMPEAQNLLVRMPAPVPEPVTLLLLGSALLGLAGFGKVKNR